MTDTSSNVNDVKPFSEVLLAAIAEVGISEDDLVCTSELEYWHMNTLLCDDGIMLISNETCQKLAEAMSKFTDDTRYTSAEFWMDTQVAYIKYATGRAACAIASILRDNVVTSQNVRHLHEFRAWCNDLITIDYTVVTTLSEAKPLSKVAIRRIEQKTDEQIAADVAPDPDAAPLNVASRNWSMVSPKK